MEISRETETKRQRKLSSVRICRPLVPLAQSESAPMDFSSRDHSQTLLHQAFDNGMYQLERGFMAVPHFHCFVSDNFSADPAITTNNATGHQLVTLCRSICAEERAQVIDPILQVSIICFHCHILIFFLVLLVVRQSFFRTLMMFLSIRQIFLSHIFAVHKIR